MTDTELVEAMATRDAIVKHAMMLARAHQPSGIGLGIMLLAVVDPDGCDESIPEGRILKKILEMVQEYVLAAKKDMEQMRSGKASLG